MCSGPMFQYQICNSEECPGPYEDFRAQQCAKRNSYYVHENAKHSWIPYEPDDGEWGPVPSTSRPVALGICWVLMFPGRAFYAWPTNRERWRGSGGTQRGIAVARFAPCLCADLCTVYIVGPPSS